MGLTFHLIANSYWESLDFELPKLPDSSEDRWRRWIDTSLDSPGDILEWEAAPLFQIVLSVRAALCGRFFREYCVSRLINHQGGEARLRAKGSPSAMRAGRTTPLGAILVRKF